MLRLVATTLMSTVGGAAGPLYGTAYLRASKATGVAELDSHGVVALLEAALDGIVARGKATHGREDDGRRLDSCHRGRGRRRPTAERRPRRCLPPRPTPRTSGAEATIPLVATKGRASYLGERSAGHLDPGARSTELILRAAAQAAA